MDNIGVETLFENHPDHIKQEILEYREETHNYILCMAKIKSRIKKIHDVLEPGVATADYRFLYESVFLQFRIIIELIVLANLVTHKKQYKGKKKFKALWKPSDILKILEKANPKFYPVPLLKQISGNTSVIVASDNRQDYFKKKEILLAYNHCSNFVHARNPYADTLDISKIRETFKIWYEKIISLLDFHLIELAGTDKLFVVAVAFDTNSPVTMYYLSKA